jgi:hypothetical protein
VQFVLISKFPVFYGGKEFLLTISANEDFQILNLKMEEERIIMCISECAVQSSSTTAIRMIMCTRTARRRGGEGQGLVWVATL